MVTRLVLLLLPLVLPVLLLLHCFFLLSTLCVVLNGLTVSSQLSSRRLRTRTRTRTNKAQALFLSFTLSLSLTLILRSARSRLRSQTRTRWKLFWFWVFPTSPHERKNSRMKTFLLKSHTVTHSLLSTLYTVHSELCIVYIAHYCILAFPWRYCFSSVLARFNRISNL